MKFFTETIFRDHTNNSARSYHLTLVCHSQLVWGRRGVGVGWERQPYSIPFFWWKRRSNTGPTDRNAEWKKYTHSSFSVWFVEKQRLKATQNTAMTAAILCFALSMTSWTRWHVWQKSQLHFSSVHHSQRTTHTAVPWGAQIWKKKTTSVAHILIEKPREACS